MLTSSAPLPRWLHARAARLGAALIESVLEVHGHAGLLERLSDARFGRALAAALGLPDENDLGRVARVLKGGLRHDEARLSLTLEPASGVVALEDGTLSPLFSIDGERVIRLRPRGRPKAPAPDVERQLGAALLVAHARPPFASAPLVPGRKTRARFSEALLARLVLDDEPSPELLRLAFGSPTGAPFGVPLLVYDEVLQALEALLHRPARRDGFRLAPLLSLYDELTLAEERASRHPLERFSRREQRFARDYGSRTRDDHTPAPALPRRPTRVAQRPLSWRPTWPRTTPGLGQRDLFAP